MKELTLDQLNTRRKALRRLCGGYYPHFNTKHTARALRRYKNICLILQRKMEKELNIVPYWLTHDY